MSNQDAVEGDESKKPLNFIEQKIEADIADGKNGGRILTRFPPEPNGYLHIGHAKAICVSFGLAAKYGGITNLRFDDTNPEKESVEYVDAIRRDVTWLGFDWKGGEYYTSDYFGKLWTARQRRRWRVKKALLERRVLQAHTVTVASKRIVSCLKR